MDIWNVVVSLAYLKGQVESRHARQGDYRVPIMKTFFLDDSYTLYCMGLECLVPINFVLFCFCTLNGDKLCFILRLISFFMYTFLSVACGISSVLLFLLSIFFVLFSVSCIIVHKTVTIPFFVIYYNFYKLVSLN